MARLTQAAAAVLKETVLQVQLAVQAVLELLL
jgi:hypothetical protein